MQIPVPRLLPILLLTFSSAVLAGAPPIGEKDHLTAPDAAPMSAEDSAPPIDNATSTRPSKVISDGNRLYFLNKGFSITPPVGWELLQNIEGLTLLMQIPKEDNVFQRNIKVIYGHEAISIDNFNLNKFSDNIVEKSSKLLGGIRDYSIRNKMIIDMKNGAKALLYYADFSLNSIDMMELHVLTSSSNGYFLITYTDLAENFESEVGKKTLDIAYNAITSAEIDAPPVGSFAFISKNALAGVGALAFISFVIFLIRRKGAKQYFDEEPSASESSMVSEADDENLETATIESDDMDEMIIHLDDVADLTETGEITDYEAIANPTMIPKEVPGAKKPRHTR